MRRSRGSYVLATVALVLLGVACSKSATPGGDLDRALDMAAGTDNGLTLAPSTQGTQVISSVERAPTATPVPAPTSHTSARRSVAPPPEVTAPAPDPEPVAEPSSAPAPAVTPAPQPRPRPTPQRTAPPGGWKSVGDVIRDAPFPINP